MPSAWGGVVNSGTNKWWQGGVNAYVESYTDTTAVVVVQARFQSRYAIQSSQYFAYTSCGSSGGEQQVTVNSPNSPYTATLRTQRFTVSRPSGTNDSKVTCTGRVRNTGSYTPGSSQASVSVTIAHIEYDEPAAPSSCSASRASDTQAKVTWENGSATSDAPRSAVLIERQTDSGGWVQIASLGASVENYTDNGISANHRYSYRVRSKGDGGYSVYDQSGYIYTTPAAPASVSAAKEADNSVTVSADVSNVNTATSYRVQRVIGTGEWEDLDAVDSFPITDHASGTVTYRVSSVRGSLESGFTQSNPITTIAPPLAPAFTSKPPAVAPVGQPLSISWNPNHPDGSAQVAAQVECSVDSGDPTTYDIEGGTTTWDVPESVTGSPCTAKVRVRTKGADPSWGEWSSYIEWSMDYAPSVVITYPETDGSVVGAIPLQIGWEVSSQSGVSSQSLSLYDSTGEEVHRAELASGARSYSLSGETYLPQNFSGYTVSVTVRGGSSLTTTATRAFSTDYAGPALPWVQVTYGEDLAAEVMVRHGNPGWALEGTTLVSPEDNADAEGVPITAGAEQTSVEGIIELGDVLPTKTVSVSRVLPDGTQKLIAGELDSGQTARDQLPPLNTEYEYMVTAISEFGTASTNDVSAYVQSDDEAFNFGPGAETCLRLGLDATGSESMSHSGEYYRFALGPDSEQLPTFYPDGNLDVSGSHSYVTYDRAVYERVRELARRRQNAVCWFRSAFGSRARAVASFSASYDAKQYMRFDISASLTEVVWEEPQNG